jgi:hypothetical protein
MLMFGFGFIMSVIGSFGPVGLVFVFAAVFALFAFRRRKRDREDNARWAAAPVRARNGAIAVDPERFELSAGAAGRAAAKVAVPAILIFPTSAIGYMLPFAVGGVLYLAVAMLILARLAGDRTVLDYDAESITVRGLLGEDTLLWDDVEDVIVRKAAFFNLKVLFSSGSTRNLVILGRRNRLGGAQTLHIPIDLIGLDRSALAALVSRFIQLQAGVPGGGSAVSPARGSAEQTGDRTASKHFDPAAIRLQHLADREALVSTQRPDLAIPRSTFGRKRV